MECGACGLTYRAGWSDSFEAELYDYYSGKSEWPEERLYTPVNRRRLEQLLAELARYVEGRRLLDVGCGTGQLVSLARAQGWDARGIDLSEPAIALGTRLGAPCERVDFFDPTLDGEHFDVIVMSEFIEHVPDPARFLRRASELLSRGGITYMTTPNFRSLSRHVIGLEWDVVHSEHISYFTPASLRRLVQERTDLEIAWMETRNISPEVIRWAWNAFSPLRRQRGATENRQETPPTGDAVRSRVEKSRALKAAKRVANFALNTAGAGESIFAVLRKRGDERGVAPMP